MSTVYTNDRQDNQLLSWRFLQSFGDDNSSDDDLVTTVQFDDTGTYVAAGDKAGRICIFEAHSFPSEGRRDSGLEFKFYTEFQSHNPEFDCLKSLEIEERVNMISWVKRRNRGLFLLATNDKTIKLWNVHEKKFKQPKRRHNGSAMTMGSGEDFLKIPRLVHYHAMTTVTPKRIFANAHGYHINSISMNSDGITFLSADDLRVNLWSLDETRECFNVIDLKPPSLEELTEVITSASFHPIDCNILIYGSSRGCVRMADLRDSALCDHNAKIFETEEDPANKSFFTEIIASVSDAKFTPDGRYIISRDYLTMKVWDVHMEREPIMTIPVHDYLQMHLCDLYGNDCIFDKFECASSNDGQRIITGSYNNNFILYDMKAQESVRIEALKDPPVRTMKTNPKTGRMEQAIPNVSSPNFDFGKKALHCSWHPTRDVVAIAGLNKLYIYENPQKWTGYTS